MARTLNARLNAKLQFALDFANFCKNEYQEPADIADLIYLAGRAFSAGEKACNEPGHDEKLRKARNVFRLHAKALGWNAEFDGLWPTLVQTDGRRVFLPSEK